MRLIDADELKVYLQEYLHYEHAIPWVDAQPTAYDVEWVVKKLQKCSEEYQNSFDEYERGKAFAYSNAISFVKAGGIDGNERTDT